MFPEPRNDTLAFTPKPQPWTLDAIESNTAANSILNEDSDYPFPYSTKTIFFVTLFISLCGLVGNGTVVWLLSFHIRRNPVSVYILNLAAADFTYSLCNVIWMLCIILDCKSIPESVMHAFIFFTYMVSLSFLTAVSTERCLSVLFPLWYKCRRPDHLSTIVCVLIWGLLFSLLLLSLLDRCLLRTSVLYTLVLHLCSVLFFIVFSVVCVSSLTLVIKVQCCSRRRQASKLYLVISLTVLVFLVFGLPLSATIVVPQFSSLFPNFPMSLNISYLLSAVNSSVNPFIYFFVGRMRQQQQQLRLRDALQSALMGDAEPREG